MKGMIIELKNVEFLISFNREYLVTIVAYKSVVVIQNIR